MQIWSLSKDKREYDNFHTLLNGKLKHTINVEKLNKALMSNQLAWMSGQMSVSIVYDGSDIRKPESEQLEHLGWARSLSGGWVRGYSTFNSIAIGRTQGRLRLLNSVPYSNGDVAEIEAQMFNFAQKFNRRTVVEFSTKLAILPNRYYVGFLFSKY